MKTNALKGMKDILPAEQKLRDYVQGKILETYRVYRAERPQKGRSREFVQCDIDILGDSSCNAEVELIDVTAHALLNIGFNNFVININDRRNYF